MRDRGERREYLKNVKTRPEEALRSPQEPMTRKLKKKRK
jgi:hypothetical protein